MTTEQRDDAGRLRDLFNNIDGQFVGVGIVMEADLGKGMKLRQVLPESPAAESGLKAGDLLGVSTSTTAASCRRTKPPIW